MQEKIDLKKTVYQKVDYPLIINTTFSELGTVSINEQIDSSVTVNEFFDLYNSLFYEIPSFGDTNSHQYLIQTSADYIDFDSNQEEILALRAEITDLRRQLLEAQVSTAEAISGESIDLDTSQISNDSLADNEEFNSIMKNLGGIPSSPTQANTTNTTGTSTTSGNSSSTSGGGGSSGGGY
tara:strand:- start:958 stop:1500 length:543 start_codon:yes stop_codon:yes gene_type:complete